MSGSFLNEFEGAEILTLFPEAQPIVSRAQEVIRHQREVEQLAADAIEYFLDRLGRDAGLRMVAGCGTETFERLTVAFAALKGIEAAEVQDYCIPGSSAIHRPRA